MARRRALEALCEEGPAQPRASPTCGGPPRRSQPGPTSSRGCCGVLESPGYAEPVDAPGVYRASTRRAGPGGTGVVPPHHGAVSASFSRSWGNRATVALAMRAAPMRGPRPGPSGPRSPTGAGGVRPQRGPPSPQSAPALHQPQGAKVLQHRAKPRAPQDAVWTQPPPRVGALNAVRTRSACARPETHRPGR